MFPPGDTVRILLNFKLWFSSFRHFKPFVPRDEQSIRSNHLGGGNGPDQQEERGLLLHNGDTEDYL